MPYEDDEARRAARERLQARMERRGSAGTLASNSAPRQSRRSDETTQQDRSAGAQRQASRRQPRPVTTGGRQPQLYTPQSSRRRVELGPLSFSIPSNILPDFIPPIAVPIAIILVVLILLFAVIIPSCSRSGEEQPAAAAESTTVSSQSVDAYESENKDDLSAKPTDNADAQAVSSAGTITQKVVNAKAKAEQSIKTASQVQSLETEETQEMALDELLGDETTAKLLAQAKTSLDALWIAAHPNAFAYDGVEVQYKVMKLAADEPKALDYVRNFPKSYPAEKPTDDKSIGMSSSSPSANIPDSDIPYLYQWDRRWGYTTYSSAPFGLTGCGPTSLAMVYQGLTGKTDMTPYDMGQLANERGYMSEYQGTDGMFFLGTAEELGLACEELYPDTEALRNALDHGQVVITNLAPGYFTTNGHYFVVTGISDNGEAIINDPYSVERSSQTWDIDLIVSQSYVMYAYSKA